MFCFIVLFSALTLRLGYATPNCHAMQQSQLASLNERMNQMISALYSSPFLSSFAKSKTTSASPLSSSSTSDYATPVTSYESPQGSYPPSSPYQDYQVAPQSASTHPTVSSSCPTSETGSQSDYGYSVSSHVTRPYQPPPQFDYYQPQPCPQPPHDAYSNPPSYANYAPPSYVPEQQHPPPKPVQNNNAPYSPREYSSSQPYVKSYPMPYSQEPQVHCPRSSPPFYPQSSMTQPTSHSPPVPSYATVPAPYPPPSPVYPPTSYQLAPYAPPSPQPPAPSSPYPGSTPTSYSVAPTYSTYTVPPDYQHSTYYA